MDNNNGKIKLTECVLKNVYLKLADVSDSQSLFEVMDRDRLYLRTFLPFIDGTKSPDDTKSFIEMMSCGPAKEPLYVITKGKESIGLIGFKSTDVENHRTEIGYWLAESFQGKGIMTNAVKMLCKMAFEKMNINRVQIKCAIDNIPSRKIPKRLGFKPEGIERDGELLISGYTDIAVYSLLKNEFSV
ncbi:MAG: GNAT family protein [Bacteroidales bacterium]|jgi:ribosomal-protein-serine acetyltransferase